MRRPAQAHETCFTRALRRFADRGPWHLRAIAFCTAIACFALLATPLIVAYDAAAQHVCSRARCARCGRSRGRARLTRHHRPSRSTHTATYVASFPVSPMQPVLSIRHKYPYGHVNVHFVDAVNATVEVTLSARQGGLVQRVRGLQLLRRCGADLGAVSRHRLPRAIARAVPAGLRHLFQRDHAGH